MQFYPMILNPLGGENQKDKAIQFNRYTETQQA